MVIETITQMQRWSDERRAEGLRIGFVPTMGYLHTGHLGLVDIARERADLVVASIFVNPTQFGPNEDLARYPRDFQGDYAKFAQHGTHVVFCPSADEMYPEGYSTYVRVEGLSDGLCGVSRPVHFRGVATICLKLFNMVKPHVAVFGKKDYQQWSVIRRLVRDLHLEIEVVGGTTAREPDGLAMSSRNAYLQPDERTAALCIKRGLESAKQAFNQNEREVKKLIDLAKASIEAQPLARIDYVEIVDAENLQPLQGRVEQDACLAAAAYLGKTRLLDNVELSVADGRRAP
ncbi:MAG: pantoate--beta-alanine ligase [Candidatus Alcyoniella australis]|nr:pantoate--beta-alanine ligase [Candidatus Alcyoniella australis]